MTTTAQTQAIALFEHHHYLSSTKILTVAQVRARAKKMVHTQVKCIARMDRKQLTGFLDGLPQTPATIGGKISRVLAQAALDARKEG